MMNYAKTGPKCNRLRAANFSLWVGIIAVVCTLQLTNSITSVETPVARDCAAWANQTFNSPSPARDEAFIDCIVRRDPSITPDAIRHKLETGDGDGLFNRLMTGENLPIMPDSNCPYLRVAVQSPVGSVEADQKPMRDLFSTALTRAGFKVVDANTTHHWWASSLTLDTGANSAAWTILARATPEIGNGAIQFTTVRKTVNGREGSFSGMQLLRAFDKDQAPEAARLAAEGIAKELLPAAHRRCGDIGATLEQARIRLEQLRNELMEEIERVRREKNEWKKAGGPLKQLQIEVEG
jgi:hypothetical protein